MSLDKKAIVEYVKDRIIQLRTEGKMDFEKTTGATVRLDLYRELYPGKVHSSVKSEEERYPGTLDKLIGEGIALGLTTPIKALKPEDVKLSDQELNEIGWDVKMALAKQDKTGADPEYAQEYKKLYEQLEAERLAEKRAKLSPGKRSEKVSVKSVPKEVKETAAYSAAEQELVNALTYVEDLKKLLTNPLAVAEAYLEMDRDLLLVWQRLEREGKLREVILVEAMAEIAPSRPRRKEEALGLAKDFWQLFGKAVAEIGKVNQNVAQKMRSTYRVLLAKGIDKNQAMKETYGSLLNSEEPEISQARRQVFAQLFPRPIEQRFKRSFRNCRKPSQGQNPLAMGEALKTALERALTIAPSLTAKKALLDTMSREGRAFMPTGKLKQRKTP